MAKRKKNRASSQRQLMNDLQTKLKVQQMDAKHQKVTKRVQPRQTESGLWLPGRTEIR